MLIFLRNHHLLGAKVVLHPNIDNFPIHKFRKKIQLFFTLVDLFKQVIHRFPTTDDMQPYILDLSALLEDFSEIFGAFPTVNWQS